MLTGLATSDMGGGDRKAMRNAGPSRRLSLLGVLCLFFADATQAKRTLLQGSSGFDGDSISREIARVLDGLFGPPPAVETQRSRSSPGEEIEAVLDGLLRSAEPVAEPRGYTLYENTECVAMRLVGAREGVVGAQACQAECDAIDACRAFTYNAATLTCLLAPDCKDRARSSGRTSGIELNSVWQPFVEESDDDASLSQGPVGQQFNMYQDTGCADGLLDTVNNVYSEEQCRALCVGSWYCRAYTFNPTKRRCYLAATCEARESEEGNISGVDASVDPMTTQFNLYERTGCPGDTLAHRGDYFSVAECEAWCQRRDDCGAFTFNPDRSRCYLKKDCDEREVEEDNISGVRLSVDECAVSPPCSTDDPDMECPVVSKDRGEMADLPYGAFQPPYEGELRGYKPTYKKNDDYPTCNFQPPRDPLPKDWVEQCIENARGVGFKKQKERRPNDECPAGWFLCKGMCYTLVQRNNRGPIRSRGYYQYDYMFVESRCHLCGGARVAFVGKDPNMKRIAAEMAEQTLNDDEATWVRRYRFLEDKNPKVMNGRPYQPWHLYITMYDDDKEHMTYQRYYTGDKDDVDSGWDVRHRNQEGSIFCVNTIPRIKQAVKHSEDSNLTMEKGCDGKDKQDKWDNDEHRWYPEKHWPFPGH